MQKSIEIYTYARIIYNKLKTLFEKEISRNLKKYRAIFKNISMPRALYRLNFKKCKKNSSLI